MQHQKDADRFMVRRNGRGCLYLEPGLGKSRVALTSARRAHRTLILAPPTPAELVWPEQRDKWAPDMSFRLVRGTPKEREAILYDERPQLAVLNYTMLHWFYDLVARKRRIPYDLLVMDECNAVKNASSIAFRTLAAIEEAFDGVIPMTGTPAENSLADNWGPCYLVDHGEALGKKIGVFRERYCRPVLRENYVRWEVSRPHELMLAAAPLCFVRKANDCLDMPPLVFNDVYFDLGKRERKFFESIDKRSVVPIDDPFVCKNTGVAYDKMRQVSSGFVYDEQRETHILGSSKFDALQECIDEAQGQPVFVGYWFSASERIINDSMYFLYGRRYPVINRDTSMADKAKYLKRWSQGRIPVLLGQIGTIAKGANMQSPHASVLFFDLPWSHGMHWQFIRRVWRYGQSTRVVVRRLLARYTKDVYVSSILKRKQINEEDFMDAILEEEII